MNDQQHNHSFSIAHTAFTAPEHDRLTTAARREPIDRCVGGRSKRFVDVTIALITLVILAVPMLVVAALIKMTMGGPIIFKHTRVGRGGSPFPCMKFRTMRSDGDQLLARHLADNPDAAREWKETRKLRRDPRITLLGSALRLSSIDELPQLFNVLRGEMSCVGPRPIVADELALYGPSAEHYLRGRPGLTGLWQVSGRSTLSYADRVKLDTEYVTGWSLWSDTVIIARTASAVLKYNQTS